MKKVLVFILAFVSSAVMFGQSLHYQADYTGCGNLYHKITGVFAIDGEQIYNGVGMQNQGGQNIEIGAFDQNEVCRFTRKPQWKSSQNAYIYQMSIRGTEGMVYHFKVYDHNTNKELDLVDDFGEVIQYSPNAQVGSSSAPYVMNFTTPIRLSIDGHEGGTGNWHLIASPIGEVAPSSVGNMVYVETEEDNFDLYYFDQAATDGLEWINYQTESGINANFGNLLAGKGYLYASKRDTTLVFKGQAFEDKYNVTDTTIALAYDGNAFWKGWNLMGNPFSVTAYIGDRAFYVMNEGGTDVEPAVVNGIPAMEGIFVVAEGENETVTFTTTAPNQQPALALNVSRDSKVVDRAIVGFGKERSLPKFQLNPSHTKVYIPQESRDYAVVTAEEMGEMPVGFKAEKNGRYTLDFTAKEVSFAYLHLIDNKTGKDVDLLESPAYSFDALTTDYASRFKLVFATGNATDDNFAFCSNGNWIISNDGEATLQVVDVTGRILSSETVSGCVSKAISAAPGVYMLRLINGDDMKVQKVVVK